MMAQNVPRHDDEFARDSFTLRRMAPWQLWSVSIFAAVVVVGLLIYAMSL